MGHSSKTTTHWDDRSFDYIDYKLCQWFDWKPKILYLMSASEEYIEWSDYMRKEFDWDGYMTNGIWVNLKNEEEARDFCAKEEVHNRWGNRYKIFAEGNRYLCQGGYTKHKSDATQSAKMIVVEWSDYMEKSLKDQLQTGWIVELRNREKYSVIKDAQTNRHGVRDFVLVNKNGFNTDMNYSCDLINNCFSEFDIMKIWKVYVGPCTIAMDVGHLSPDWVRNEEPEVKEITMAELEEKYGCKVKIVKE